MEENNNIKVDVPSKNAQGQSGIENEKREKTSILQTIRSTPVQELQYKEIQAKKEEKISIKGKLAELNHVIPQQRNLSSEIKKEQRKEFLR